MNVVSILVANRVCIRESCFSGSHRWRRYREKVADYVRIMWYSVTWYLRSFNFLSSDFRKFGRFLGERYHGKLDSFCTTIRGMFINSTCCTITLLRNVYFKLYLDLGKELESPWVTLGSMYQSYNTDCCAKKMSCPFLSNCCCWIWLPMCSYDKAEALQKLPLHTMKARK